MKTYKIELTEQQLSVLSNCLIEAPYKVVAPLIQSLNAQIQAAPAEAEAPEGD